MAGPQDPSTMISRIRDRAAAGDEDAMRILKAVEERDAAEAAERGAAPAPSAKRAGDVEDKMAKAGI
mgnify:FL=1